MLLISYFFFECRLGPLMGQGPWAHGPGPWAGPMGPAHGPSPWAGPMGPRRGPAGARAPHRRKLSAKLFRKMHSFWDVPLKTKKNRGKTPCKTAKSLCFNLNYLMYQEPSQSHILWCDKFCYNSSCRISPEISQSKCMNPKICHKKNM